MKTEFIQTVDNIETKKKITIYELLGLIKDGKAPKKIKYCGAIYEWKDIHKLYTTEKEGISVCLGGADNEINMFVNAFNENVEILDEEDEFIDIEEIKIDKNGYIKFEDGIWKGRKMDVSLSNKINELIKNQKVLINKLKEEGK